ncbi:glycoside hydrolase family 2, partial [Colletotrichum tofieldiae]
LNSLSAENQSETVGDFTMATSNSIKILIIGGTGKVGRQITKLFAATSIPTYQASRSGAATTEQGADNIKPIAFDWDDEKTWTAALDAGATSIFLVAPPVMDMMPPMQSFIDQARFKGHAKRFVLLSGSPVEPDINGYAMGRPHAYLKELGDKGEVEWAAIRPTWFQQNFAEQDHHCKAIVNESTIYSATVDGKIPWAATEDIAACAYQLLTQEDAPNDQYLILGPELLSYDDIAETLSEVLGRKIVHKKLSAQELVERFASQGMPRDYAEMMSGLDTAIKNGSENRTNSVVLALTGKQPRKFRDTAESNKGVWATAAPAKTGTGDGRGTVNAPNLLTYPKASEPFSQDLFESPTSEYRGCPLWSWNTKLEKKRLLRQIDHLKDMGMGGFHMHVRTGLDTEYMGPEFMDRVRDCVEYAESKGMLACLYDDDRWPSGVAGGKVVKQYPEYKSKHILFTPYPYGSVELGGGCAPSSAQACRSEMGYLLARFSITLDENGRLKSRKKLQEGEDAEPGGRVWYAYVEINPPSSWFNGQTYIDTMSTKAMTRFLESTHEVYKSKIGDKFGTTVPCIFTDEPQVAIKTQLSSPGAIEDVFLPWTADLPDTFRESYGDDADLISSIPELLWDLPGDTPSLARYRFHDHVSERFVTSFLDLLASWCRKNKIMLNGHMMEEPTLRSQTTAHGEAMRCYRNQTLPGMDLLNDWVEYNTAKQCTSVARQNGVRGAMSEIYGCTHWYFSFESHKGCGDWHAALGITFRVQHLSWVSMAGEGKRDYPASIGYQSPWYKEYKFIEDHFARVGVALTRGKAVTRVGVVHPIESFWLCFGPNNSGDDEIGRRDQAFAELTNWLLHALVDFDFIAESFLPNQISEDISTPLKVGHCEYDIIILPNLRTIRSSTLDVVKRFAAAGGKVIIAGEGPVLVDAQVAPPDISLSIEPCTKVAWNKDDILSAVSESRDLKVDLKEGGPTETLLYQMRQDGDEMFLFICNTDRNNPYNTLVSIKGDWDVEVLDTFTGKTHHQKSKYKKGWTTFEHRFEGCASLLLRFYPVPAEELSFVDIVEQAALTPPSQQIAELKLEDVVLSEPNVLMLDYALYRIDDDPWEDATRQEILKIDNEIRSRLRLPLKGSAWKQPWSVPQSERAAKVYVDLRFEFESQVIIKTPSYLAMENPENARITINGHKLPVDEKSLSWWVDEDIRTIPVPKRTIRRGKNVVELSMPFGILTNLERIYLLGSFSVELKNNLPILYERRQSLGWGDVVAQGHPFYAGNVTYNCSFSLKSRSNVTLSVPQFATPVLKVQWGNNSGHIALQPRTLALGEVEAGKHKISITAFGYRYNSFGHVHLTDGIFGCWPDQWRTGGWAWSDEYRLKPTGVLEKPSILVDSKVGKESEDWIVLVE